MDKLFVCYATGCPSTNDYHAKMYSEACSFVYTVFYVIHLACGVIQQF